MRILRDSRKVTVSRTAASDFLDYDALFKELYKYKDLAGLVKKNHIFDCTEDGTMIIRESDLDENGRKFNGAKATTPKDLNTLKARSKELLTVVAAPGINPYKQMELYQKYKSVVPIEYHNNELYVTPPEDVIKKVAAEKVMRNENRSRLKCLKEGGSEAELLVGVQCDADVKKMKVADLRNALKENGLDTVGKKLDLQTRLQEFRDKAKSTSSGSGSQIEIDNVNI